jgi:hypothetical protein
MGAMGTTCTLPHMGATKVNVADVNGNSSAKPVLRRALGCCTLDGSMAPFFNHGTAFQALFLSITAA